MQKKALPIKSRGKYWYLPGNTKTPLNLCKCGNFKGAYAKLCYKCTGTNSDGTIKKKPDDEKKLHQDGYILIYKPNHPFAHKNGYIMEHRFVMEQWLRENKPNHPALIEIDGKKYLRPNWIPHHKNEKRDDNRIDNLKLMTKDGHNKHHNPKTGAHPMRYGKHLTHRHDYCSCGNLKDVRSRICNKCWNEKRGLLLSKRI